MDMNKQRKLNSFVRYDDKLAHKVSSWTNNVGTKYIQLEIDGERFQRSVLADDPKLSRALRGNWRREFDQDGRYWIRWMGN